MTASDADAPMADRPEGFPFDSDYYRGVLLEYTLTAVLLAAFHFSGASASLAAGATRWTGGRWWLANAVYIVVALLGVAAAVFPVHWARARRLAAALDGTGAGWTGLYTRVITGDAALTFAFFNATYALLRWTPHRWWMIAAALYAAFAVVAPALLPWLAQPRLYQPRPLGHPELERRLRALAGRAGHPLIRVGVWEEDDSANFPPVLLAGTRRDSLILSARLASEFPPEEIEALVARKFARVRQRHVMMTVIIGTTLSAAAFVSVHFAGSEALRRLGPHPVTDARDIAGFPLLALAIMAASGVALPALRALRRAQTYSADAFAARWTSAATLESALRRLAGQPAPLPRWIEWLFSEQPALERRIRRLREAGAAGSERPARLP